MDSVIYPRTLLLAIFVTAVVFPTGWQPAVTSLYTFLHSSWLYQASWFETALTVLCYGTIEPIYTALLARNPDRRIDARVGREQGRQPPLPKMKRPSHRLGEMLTYVAPLLLLDLTLVKKYNGVDVASIRESGGYSPELTSVHAHFMAPSIHRFSWASPLQTMRALPAEAPSSRRLMLELVTSLILYDALFFTIHFAFHRVPILHRLHEPHHGHQEIHPQITNRLTVPERMSLVLLANFALNIIGSHVMTRTFFVPIFVYLLIEVHSGVDLDWQYDKLLPRGWGAGARKHAAHHRHGMNNFQPFFCWIDAWLDSLDRDSRYQSPAST